MNPKIKKHGLFLLGIAVCFAVAAIAPVIDADDKDIAFVQVIEDVAEDLMLGVSSVLVKHEELGAVARLGRGLCDPFGRQLVIKILRRKGGFG